MFTIACTKTNILNDYHGMHKTKIPNVYHRLHKNQHPE